MIRNAMNLGLMSVIAASIGAAASADTAVLTSVADNTIIEDPAGAYSCGGAQYFFAGRVGVNGASGLRRGALRFDFSSIPAGAIVTSVTLRMNCSAAGHTAAETVSLKRFTASWGEGASVAFGGGGAPAQPNDVTWLHRHYPSTLWTTPGGEFAATASTSRSVTGVGLYVWPTSTQFVTDVQQMIATPASNFGWCVVGNEVTLQSVKRFDSRESGGATSKPQLTVVYTAPPRFDLTGDGKVNAADLAVLIAAWGATGPGDFDGNGVVGAPDLSALLAAWTL